jgi:3-polyprenyl-4-hydroxybenzoate decarboxylase
MYDMYRYDVTSTDRAAAQLSSQKMVAEHPRRRARKSHSVLPAVLTVGPGPTVQASSSS